MAAAKVPAVPLQKVLKLMTGPNSQALHERHLSALDRLCAASTGFSIPDLPQAQQLLEITLGLVARGMAEFVDPAVKFLRALSRPFVKHSSTDEVRLLGNITNTLLAVSRILVTADTPLPIQLAASEFLLVYASGYGTRPSVLTRVPSLEELSIGSPLRQYLLNCKLLAQSGALDLAVQALAAACASDNEELAMSLGLTLCQASFSPLATEPLLAAGLLPCLSRALALPYTHALVPVAVELLWNILEHDTPKARAVLTYTQPSLLDTARGSARAVTAAATAAASLEGTQPTETVSRGGGEAPEAEANGEEDGAVASGDRQTGAGDLDSVQEEPAGADSQGDAPVLLPQPAQGCVLPDMARALAGLFQSLLLQGYRAVDKALRNDVLAVINLVMGTDHVDLPQPGRHPKDTCGALFCAAVQHTGVFEALLVACCCPEGGLPDTSYAHIAKPWALTTEEPDLELKLLAWRATVAACMHTGARGMVLPLTRKYNLMHVLLACAAHAPEAVAQGMAQAAVAVHSRWPSSSRRQLQAEALARLHSLSALCPELYLAESAQQVFFSLLTTPPSSPGAAPLLDATLRNLHHLVKHAPEMAEVIGEGEGLRPMLGLLQATDTADTTRRLCLMLLASLCRVNVDNLRRLRHEGGVKAVLGCLAAAKTMDPTLPSSSVIAALDAVWACIVVDRKNTAKFLVDDGMDVLLDLLDRGNAGHRAVLLSVLCDLLENPRSHPYFHGWRSGRDGRSAAQLLLDVWRVEEAARHMTDHGVLTNTVRPLSGTGDRAPWVPPEGLVYVSLGASLGRSGSQDALASTDSVAQPGPTPTPAALAVAAMIEASTGERVLAKVYGSFHQLGFGKFGALAPADAATLALVDTYVKFKQGEVWVAIREELAASAVRPTTPDEERLDSGIELAEHLGCTVRDTQRLLMERELAAAAAKETEVFEAMRRQQRLEQEARFYQKDKSQLTLAELREAKQKKEAMLRSSIQHVQRGHTAAPGELALGPGGPV